MPKPLIGWATRPLPGRRFWNTSRPRITVGLVSCKEFVCFVFLGNLLGRERERFVLQIRTNKWGYMAVTQYHGYLTNMNQPLWILWDIRWIRLYIATLWRSNMVGQGKSPNWIGWGNHVWPPGEWGLKLRNIRILRDNTTTDVVGCTFWLTRLEQYNLFVRCNWQYCLDMIIFFWTWKDRSWFCENDRFWFQIFEDREFGENNGVDAEKTIHWFRNSILGQLYIPKTMLATFTLW